jgi:periplasmic protein TonB
MSAAAYRGDPWRRLPWVLPAALLLSLVTLTGFWALIVGKPYRPTPPQAIQVEVVELPPPAAPPVAAPPPPPVVEPEPPPPPPPEPEAKPLPEPLPPPPPPRHHIVRPAKPPPSPAPPPPPQTAAAPTPAPPAAAPVPPGGAIMGARAIYKPLPEIPGELLRRGVPPAIPVRFHVAADGSAQVELLEPTPDPELNQLLIAALKKWRWFPAMENGKPVASDPELRIHLNGAEPRSP